MEHPDEQATVERPVEPLYLSISDTMVLTGLSTVTVYRLIAKEKLVCVKAGAKSLVEVASIRRYLASLPRFVGTTGRAARDPERRDRAAEEGKVPDPPPSPIRPGHRTSPGSRAPARGRARRRRPGSGAARRHRPAGRERRWIAAPATAVPGFGSTGLPATG
jgi:hypothetical protein